MFPNFQPRVTRIGRIEQYYEDPELDGLLPNEAGCARASGFQKMDSVRNFQNFEDKYCRIFHSLKIHLYYILIQNVLFF